MQVAIVLVQTPQQVACDRLFEAQPAICVLTWDNRQVHSQILFRAYKAGALHPSICIDGGEGGWWWVVQDYHYVTTSPAACVQSSAAGCDGKFQGAEGLTPMMSQGYLKVKLVWTASYKYI